MKSIQGLSVFLIVLVASCAYAQYELPQDNPTASQIPSATPAQTPPAEAGLPQTTVSEPTMMPQPMPVTPQMPAQVPDPQPISAPTDVVTPAELEAAKSLIQEIYKLNGDSGIPQCDAAKLISDYYALSVVNCDKAQDVTLKDGGTLTECPLACKTGIDHVGTDCAAALNLNFIKNQSAVYGPSFQISEFDPLGTAPMCGVSLPEESKIEAYVAGQISYLWSKAGGQVDGCDAEKLTGTAFIQAKAKCDIANSGSCDPNCQKAVDEISKPCLEGLKAVAQSDQALYDSNLKTLEVCLLPSPTPSPTQAATPSPTTRPSSVTATTPPVLATEAPEATAPSAGSGALHVAMGVSAMVAAGIALILQ